MNGKPRDARNGITVNGLLEEIKVDARYVAVAVNGAFVPRSEYGETAIRKGDDVEIVSPQAGG